MAVREDKLKKGTLLQVKRKCSPKVQPHIIDNSLYLVLEELPKTKSGARRLAVVEFEQMAKMAMITPHAHIPRKDINIINEDRFSWIVKSRQTLKEKTAAYKENFIKEQEQKQDEQIRSKFTDRERSQMAYTPYLYAELAWHYAHKAINLCVDRKIDGMKKVTRTVRGLRADFLSELRKKMPQPVIACAQDKVKQAIEDNYMDFFKMEMTVQNELNFQHLRTANDDIKTYAYISMLCYEAQRRVDIANARLIEKRLGGIADVVESYKYMKELYDCMKAYVGDCKVKNTYNITNAIKIMEKNIGSLSLS